MLRTIERPTYAALRPCAAVASRICCTRWMCEAKQATTIFCFESRNTWSMTGVIETSSRREAGGLGVGRVGEEEVDALLPQPRERAQVGDPPVERELVHLEVAGVQHQLAAGADRDGERVRDGVVDRDELQVERPHA